MKQRSTRSYRALVLAAVLGPAMLFVAVAMWSWNVVHRDADDDITRSVTILQEQALRLLQVDEMLLRRIDDRIAGMSRSEIAAREEELSRFLKTAIAPVAELDAAFILDTEGDVVASSAFFPLAARQRADPVSLNLQNRSYFAAIRDGEPFVIGGPHPSRTNRDPVIDIAMRLTAPDGSFRGAAVLIISARRLAAPWQSMLETGNSVNLVNAGGTVLARYPGAPFGPGDAPPHFLESSMVHYRSATAGMYDTEGSAIDGIVRRSGFRKLGGFPLYIVYAVARDNIIHQWYPIVAAFGVLTAIAAFGLVLTALAVIRRARGEERERLFSELLIENSIDGIICKDRELRYTVWSSGMERMTGIPRERVIGRRTEEVFGPSAVGTSAEDIWLDALAGGTNSVNDQRYVFPQTGLRGFYDQTLSPLRAAEGAIIGAMAFVHDTTERHRIEEVLRQSQKMEAVGQLTGGIAHDFNNLLTVILGNLETLRRREDGNREARRFIDAAMQGAERATTLTSRLLAFSRRQPLDPRPLDPNRLVAGMSDLLRRTLGERIVIETALDGALYRIAADANQIESALLNLAVNARDAMPKGGKLTIETANAQLDKDHAAAHDIAPGDYAAIAVSDTGEGMATDVLARAFEPFFTTKEVGKGSGLGLSQVYGFMKQLGGNVTIDSERGQGTKVTLYFPRLPEDAAAGARAAPPRGGANPPLAPPRGGANPPLAPPRGNETVLVVEDDRDVREHAARLLDELGYRVLEAPDGPSALPIIEATPDLQLLFTDIGLPGELSGRELAAAAAARRPGLKVLFTTAYARNGAALGGRLDAGAQLLVKPFSFATFAAKLREVLDGG